MLLILTLELIQVRTSNNDKTITLFQIGMSSFLENIRLNDDLKEKLYSASDKVLNYVNERPLWERFRSEPEFF